PGWLTLGQVSILATPARPNLSGAASRSGFGLKVSNASPGLDGRTLPGLPELDPAALDQHDRVGMERYRRPRLCKAVLPCGGFALKTVQQITNPTRNMKEQHSRCRKPMHQRFGLLIGSMLLVAASAALADNLILNTFDSGISGIDWQNFRSYISGHDELWDG